MPATINYIDTSALPQAIRTPIPGDYTSFGSGGAYRSGDALRWLSDIDADWEPDYTLNDQDTLFHYQVLIGFDDASDHDDIGPCLFSSVAPGSETGYYFAVWEGNVRIYAFSDGDDAKTAVAAATYALASLTTKVGHRIRLRVTDLGSGNYSVAVYQNDTLLGTFSATGNVNGWYLGWASGMRQDSQTAGKFSYIKQFKVFQP